MSTNIILPVILVFADTREKCGQVLFGEGWLVGKGNIQSKRQSVEFTQFALRDVAERTSVVLLRLRSIRYLGEGNEPQRLCQLTPGPGERSDAEFIFVPYFCEASWLEKGPLPTPIPTMARAQAKQVVRN